MRALVTGATGFVGQEVVRQLYEAGHSIRILVRNADTPRVKELISRDRVEALTGDVLDVSSLKGVVNGMDAVIHLVGIIAEAGASTFEKVHTCGTANIVSASQQAKAGRFIHMSALGTRPNAASRYHQTKWAAEEAVRHSGLDYTIFRPSLIYGTNDQFINLFARLARFSPIVPLLAGPHARFQPVSVEAVAAAFARSLGEPKSVGQTYDLCGPETLTLAEIVDRITAVVRRKRWKLQVPLRLARCQAYLLELVFRHLLRTAPPFTRDQLVMLQEDNVGNPQPANELFALRQVRLSEGIAKYLSRDA